MTRSDFAKILHSRVIPEGTPPNDINAMVRPISNAVSQMLPSSLFRYRKCDEFQIEAFESDTIYAVTANRFNDPYDMLVRFDQEAIKIKVSSIVNCKTLEAMKPWFAAGNDFSDAIKQILPAEALDDFKSRLASVDIDSVKDRIDDSRESMLSLIDIWFPALAEASKKNSTMACFSESIQSVLMWSHYADSHTGFALEYDFRPTLNDIKNAALFPVIY